MTADISGGDSTPKRTDASGASPRELDEVFGDVLPEWTCEEEGRTAGPGGSRAVSSARDEELLGDVPPHHG